MLDEHYRFLGNSDVPPERYYSPAFFQREIDRMWPRSWQWACRTEQMPETGDSHVYEAGPYSILVAKDEVAARHGDVGTGAGIPPAERAVANCLCRSSEQRW